MQPENKFRASGKMQLKITQNGINKGTLGLINVAYQCVVDARAYFSLKKIKINKTKRERGKKKERCFNSSN